MIDFVNIYYKTKDGNYIKMADIKPLSISEIQIKQDDLHIIPCDLDLSEKSMETVTFEHSDEFMVAIDEMIQQHLLDKDMYVICEMAKRYVYLMSLNDKEKENETK